ncbi:hypothetical protein BH23THE1_BH23THE1_14940 [soil metagenome]
MDKTYGNTILKNLEDKIVKKDMLFGFPNLYGNRHIAKSKVNGCNKGQLTLMKFM